MSRTIRTIKAEADALYRDALMAQVEAERARSDYARLARENRDRFAGRGYGPDVADAHFGNYAVAKDCIDTEQMNGRWATERFTRSNAAYEQAERLLTQMADFLSKRQAVRPRPAPRQRSES